MPVSEKQKGYARKWDKENMHTISTRVRMEEFKDYKAWCEMRGVTVTSEIKRLLWASLTNIMLSLNACMRKNRRSDTKYFVLLHWITVLS